MTEQEITTAKKAALTEYREAEIRHAVSQRCLIAVKDAIQKEMDKHFNAMRIASDKLRELEKEKPTT